MTCNGYSNDETWQVSLWIEDYDLSEQELKDSFLNLKNEIFKDKSQYNRFCSALEDLLTESLNVVNWKQLTELNGIDSDEDDTEEDDDCDE